MRKPLSLAAVSLLLFSQIVLAQTTPVTYLNLSSFGPNGTKITGRSIGSSGTTFTVESGGTSSGTNYGGDGNGNFNASTANDAATSTSVITYTFSKPLTVILSKNTTSTMGNFDCPDEWVLNFSGSYSFSDPNGSFGTPGTSTGTNTLTLSPTCTAAPSAQNLADAAWSIELFNVSSLSLTFRSTVSGSTNLRSPLRIGVQTETTLPVRLQDFSATAAAGKVNLQWKVAGEVKLDEYRIERSADGENYAAIGQVKAGSATPYHFVDESPLAGSNFYRLNMIDADGSQRYSPVQKVEVLQNSALKVNTNPFQNEIVLEFQSTTARSLVAKLLNAAGTVVRTKHFQVTAGANRLVIPATALLSKGHYFLQLLDQNGQSLGTKQMIKQ